jgi:hypothetical protein
MQEVATTTAARRELGIDKTTNDRPLMLPWIFGLAVAVAASLWLWKAGQDSQRANAELRERTAQRLAERDRQQGIAPPQPLLLIQQPSVPTTDVRETNEQPHERLAEVPSEHLQRFVVAPMALPSGPAPIVGIGATGRDPTRHDDYVPEEKTEPYWRRRLAASKIRLRDALEMLRAQACVGGYGDLGQTDYARAKGSYEAARMTHEALEEEARRAAVPPGWVRLDWSEYPTIDELVRGCETNR